jgi:tetratricopeptide (TPR) repeat protein/uncharacterized protein (AIM24 family)
MRESSPRAPFDQGLFLTHFNKGKQLYEDKRFEEAERQLEEAYLLRPRDQKVLNLLGLVYFKQDKYEKAEEVYRKLAAESPEAYTLFYNLGLINFKLNRLQEAEQAFLKALELSQGSPKINFYLGSIYERLQRFQDAIYHYRQAGANIMVRRVEDKIAQGGPSRVQKVKQGKRPADTAEFKAQEIRESVRRAAEQEALLAQKTVGPVSPSLMAEGAPPRNADTARFHVADTLPPTPPGRFSDIISFPAGGEVLPERALPVKRIERFRFLENNLMEIDFSGKVFIKQGTLYSYSGNLTFWVKERRGAGSPPLVIITGTGKVILTDKDRAITFMHVEDEAVFVEPQHLLACEETLTPRYVPLQDGATSVEFVALEGRGMVALSVASKPITLSVTPDLPVSVPSSSLISWSGPLRPQVVDDRQLRELMLPEGGGRTGCLIRLAGSGRLLLEQGLF